MPQDLDDSAALPCARCGYDLRAHPRDGVCPECETPVRKAVELWLSAAQIQAMRSSPRRAHAR